MITLVGVGHVFAISDNVKDIIRSKNPEVVCLELDAARFNSLMSKNQNKKVPLQYMLLASIQRRMANKFGSEVGDEMMAAFGAAQEIGAKVALIDMEASMVFNKMWRTMSLKERISLFMGALIGLVASKEKVEHELEAYAGNEAKYLDTLGEQFPSIKKVLLDDRNVFMAERIASLATKHQNILAIVGDGHISGLTAALAGQEVETVRLKDVRNGSALPESSSTDYSISYRYDHQ